MTRRTKLVCTIGPATADRLDELVEAGMDVARINFAHGTPGSWAAAVDSVRAAGSGSGRSIAVLADLSGPKIRLGELATDTVELETGQPFVLRAGDADDRPGDCSAAAVSYGGLAGDVRVGDPVFLADGAVQLEVVAIDGDHVRTSVVRGGIVRARAGVAIPSERLTAPALTDKDRADIPRAIELGADLLAQSFVRGPDDVRELRTLVGPDGPPIVAKIETRPAIDAFDGILEVADSVMVARGDLGVEIPYEQVPIIQKQLIRRALDRGIPTIVATQMLESMTASPRPTRAEASDVANAVFDGADAIMLSGETAIGAFPILAAEAAARIASRCEQDGADYLADGMTRPPDTITGSLAYAAVALTRTDPSIAAIGCYTRTGRTARILSSLRPHVPILAFSPDPDVVNRLALVHGVVARRSDALHPDADRLERLGGLVELAGVAPGAMVVLVSSSASPGSGPTRIGIHRAASA
jgi:pyruvate kinase